MLKEVQDEMEEDEEDGEAEEDDEDDDEDSEGDELEETEEDCLERYARAATALENGTVVEEGDVEDQEHEVELGKSDYTLFSRKCNNYLQRSMKP